MANSRLWQHRRRDNRQIRRSCVGLVNLGYVRITQSSCLCELASKLNMGDKMLDSTQLLSGAAVLLSFFVGYKYALKISARDVHTEQSKAAESGKVNQPH